MWTNLMTALPLAAETGTGTGTEWMVVASVVVPAVLIVVLLLMGNRRTV